MIEVCHKATKTDPGNKKTTRCTPMSRQSFTAVTPQMISLLHDKCDSSKQSASPNHQRDNGNGTSHQSTWDDSGTVDACKQHRSCGYSNGIVSTKANDPP